MKKFLTPFVWGLIVLTALISCREDTLPVNNIPTATSVTISNITPFSVDLYGSITQTSCVAEYGFVLGSNSDFSDPSTIKYPIENQHLSRFSATITGLSQNTVYLCATYAKNELGDIIYSSAKGFSIPQFELDSNKIIYYTSSDGRIITPSRTDVFDANIVWNIYANGQGMILFDDKVTSIGEYAFGNCSSLTSVTIPDSVTKIGGSAFDGCTSLTSVTIGNGVTSIGGYAFSRCSSLTSVYISDLSAWCKIYFQPCGTSSFSLANPLYFGEKLYLNGEEVTNLIIPNDVTEIKNFTFLGCSSLTSVTIPDSVTSIGTCAFDNCSSLTSVTIGNGVTSIGNSAFSYCNSLTSVYCKPTTPPTAPYTMFNNNASGRKIYVPTESAEAYKAAQCWRTYADAIIGYEF